MAEETVDRAIEEYGLHKEVKRGCITTKLQLVGSQGWTKMMFVKLIQQFGMDVSILSFQPLLSFPASTSAFSFAHFPTLFLIG